MDGCGSDSVRDLHVPVLSESDRLKKQEEEFLRTGELPKEWAPDKAI